MATAGLIQHMLKCCGSEHEKVMARVPRSDESMRGRLDELLRLSTKNVNLKSTELYLLKLIKRKCWASIGM